MTPTLALTLTPTLALTQSLTCRMTGLPTLVDLSTSGLSGTTPSSGTPGVGG